MDSGLVSDPEVTGHREYQGVYTIAMRKSPINASVADSFLALVNELHTIFNAEKDRMTEQIEVQLKGESLDTLYAGSRLTFHVRGGGTQSRKRTASNS